MTGRRSGRRSKPGPRPRAKANRRSGRLQIMLAPALDVQVTAAAEAAGQSRSDWGAALVKRALETSPGKLDLGPEPCEAHGERYCDCDK